MYVASISDYLDTYAGRDKILRTLSYAAKLGSGLSASQTAATKFQIFGSQMSSCRVILRLLDDIPMLHHTISYGWGKREPDWLIRWVELTRNLVDTIFYPIEHVCWASDHKILTVDTTNLDNLSTWCWIISLYLSLVKSSRKLNQLQKHKTCVTGAQCDVGVALRVVNAQQRNELLTCIRLLLDLSYAVNYLPQGILWGGRLKTWHVGALGTISSVMGLYQSFSQHIAQKKYP